jgi:hypothetical protein
MNAPSSQYRVPVLEALCAFVRAGTEKRPECPSVNKSSL